MFRILFGVLYCCLCFFKQKTAYELRISDWSSDVCSSDLLDTVLERANLGLQRLGLGVVSGDIIMAVAVAADAVLGADDAADRHDEDDADDHFKRAHGEDPFLFLFYLSGASRSFSISSSSEARRVGKECVSRFRFGG